jgi:hypothetical protein
MLIQDNCWPISCQEFFDPAGAIFQEGIMTAVLLDDIDVATATPPAARLALAPEQQATRRIRRAPIDTGGDPMVDAATRLLSIPLRHVYAALWRVGVIEVR